MHAADIPRKPPRDGSVTFRDVPEASGLEELLQQLIFGLAQKQTAGLEGLIERPSQAFGAGITGLEMRQAGVRQIGPNAYIGADGNELSPQEVMQRLSEKESPYAGFAREAEALEKKYAGESEVLEKEEAEVSQAAQKRVIAFLDRTTRGLTPQEIADIRTIRTESFETAASDISRWTKQQRDITTQEITPRRGLRPTDTPIVRELGLIGEEGTRQIGQVSRGLAIQEAGELLERPFRIAEFASRERAGAMAGRRAGLAFRAGLTGMESGDIESARNFQAGLADAATRNRLAMFGAPPPGMGLASALAQIRLGSATETTTEKRPGPSAWELLFAGIQAGGSAAGGAGSLWKAYKV